MRQIIGIILAITLVGCTSTHMSYNQKNASLLRYSAAGDTAKAEEMIGDGANINVKNRYGDTPLHLALRNKHQDTATFLINKGANINAPGALGDSPLHVSVYQKESGLTELLRQKGANEELLNSYGLRPREMSSLPDVEKAIIATAELLNTGGGWIDTGKARTLYSKLRNLNANHVTNALVLQVINNDPMRLRTLILAIKLGIAGSEQKLASLLMVYGDKSMAEDYLNCGSSILDSAGRKWANSHGYRITTGVGSHRAAWGRF